MANVSDAIYTLDHLFRGGPRPGCLEAADSDDNGVIDLTDPVWLLNYLFRGGPPPPYPSPAGPCGKDPVESPALGCVAHEGC